MIHIKGSFESVEAKIIKAKDAKAVICDRNNFSFINFEKKEISCGGKDRLSVYLFNKAIDQGAEGKKMKLPEEKKVEVPEE